MYDLYAVSNHYGSEWARREGSDIGDGRGKGLRREREMGGQPCGLQGEVPTACCSSIQPHTHLPARQPTRLLTAATLFTTAVALLLPLQAWAAGTTPPTAACQVATHSRRSTAGTPLTTLMSAPWRALG